MHRGQACRETYARKPRAIGSLATHRNNEAKRNLPQRARKRRQPHRNPTAHTNPSTSTPMPPLGEQSSTPSIEKRHRDKQRADLKWAWHDRRHARHLVVR